MFGFWFLKYNEINVEKCKSGIYHSIETIAKC